MIADDPIQSITEKTIDSCLAVISDCDSIHQAIDALQQLKTNIQQGN